ncbi:ubiquitin carboxyl-terminal hydrolase 9-like [Andrographis paniculata]|uniref:ubiquitin carboxyl-terminal hydrolase 9-like n=1 Tax=Andrographis paniculata TaxID=175694 RepID=UPI0021E94440|nr:ubiquitin carboxyl-terminal hydrolase 9-like [Andrographis paniculata]
MTIPDSSGYNYMMENGSIELPCKPEEEKRIVRELNDKAESNLREGDLYYVISSKWFMAWQRYTGQVEGSYPFEDRSDETQSLLPSNSDYRPGMIDNTDIIVTGGDKDDDPQIVMVLNEGPDYVLIPQEVWEKLHKWYKGGPALPRKVISVGDKQKQLVVEVFPLCFRLIDSRDQSERTLRLSKKVTLHDLYVKVCHLKGLSLDEVHIWDYFGERKQSILTPSSQFLGETNLQMNQSILLEVRTNGYGMDSTGNGLALVPVEPARSPFSIAGGPTMSNGNSTGFSSNTYHQSIASSTFGNLEDGHDGLNPGTRGERAGLAGLQNLGNTCFMNSAVQCLVHTAPLVEYFLQDYSEEINRENPLGLRGELAVSFGELLRKLWSSGRSPVAPRAFKGKLARFAPQFSGYNQHDAQELLSFLLDGLHEDLNRVADKPYIETKDSDGRPDEEVADEFWRYFKARNDSIIIDICEGQYKSTLVCPVCSKISITFDPFNCLSLPLPSTATRSMTVTVFYGDGSGLPMPFTVTVLKQGCCKDLNQALAIACCLRSDEYLLLAEVYEHRVYRYLEKPSEPLATTKDDEHIVAYRLPKKEGNSIRLEISHRYEDIERKLFLTPLVTILEDIQSGDDIDLAVSRVLSPLRKKTFVATLRSHQSGQNGSDMNAMEEETISSHAQQGQAICSIEEIGPQAMSSGGWSFRLCITDDKGYGCRPIAKDTPIKAGPVIKVMLDWTDKEHELYDSSYLKDLPEVHKSGILAKKTKQEAISLFSCLDAFLKEEPLGPDDMWYCPRCKEFRQASKKLDLWRLPDVLVFHLKRFSYSRWLKNKLDTFVNFPIHNLDLNKYVRSKGASEGSHVYELYAVSNHYGGLAGGHYSAYCKLIDENKWYHFDDSHVSPVNESEIKTSAAYVLFYQRVKSNSGGAVGEASGHMAS